MATFESASQGDQGLMVHPGLVQDLPPEVQESFKAENLQENQNQAAQANQTAPAKDYAATPAPQTPQQDQQLEQLLEQPTPQQQPSAPKQSWSELRYKADRAERERDEAYRLIQEIKAQQQKHVETPEPESDFSLGLAPDALAEGKHLSAVEKKIKRLEQQLQSYQQKTIEMTVEARLKATYPDFDSVVTPDAIAQLRTAQPELAATLNSSNDLYNKAASAYKLIKQFGFSQQQPTQNFEHDRLKAFQNSNKPKPTAAISPQRGESPLSKANVFAEGLTKDLKQQLLAEMNAARSKG